MTALELVELYSQLDHISITLSVPAVVTLDLEPPGRGCPCRDHGVLEDKLFGVDDGGEVPVVLGAVGGVASEPAPLGGRGGTPPGPCRLIWLIWSPRLCGRHLVVEGREVQHLAQPHEE